MTRTLSLDVIGGARIAVVNRGDAAMRVVHAVRELNLAHGTGHRTIALHTEEEAAARFVELADEAYDLGPARAPSDGGLAYLDLDRLSEALARTGADVAWVGWGFVAERPEFAECCAALGVVLAGPSADVMRRLGDKVGAKRLAESASVPVVPWSGGVVAEADEALEVADRVGYPVLLKASAGGGGRGIRVVPDPSAMTEAFAAATREAKSAFGDGSVFVEKVVRGARHVEVQIAADDAGTVWAVGTRDCTIQRRRQKIIEESGIPGAPAEVVERLCDAAVRLAGAADYTGVGTVEFLLDPLTNRFYFMEVNTRLQVEHTVTEETTGLDLVKLQLGLALGNRLTGTPPPARGCAIEARVTTEDAAHGFRPAPGVVDVWESATGPGLRFDTGLALGDAVPPEFDPLAVKVIAKGADRAEALARLRRALAETQLVIRDGATTLGFLRALLARPEITTLSYSTDWVDGLAGDDLRWSGDGRAAALLIAAIARADREWSTRATALFDSAARGRPEAEVTEGIPVDLTADGAAHRLVVHRLGVSAYLVVAGGDTVAVDRLPARTGTVVVRCGGKRFRAHVRISDDLVQVDLDGDTYRLRTEQAGVVRAPAPSVVVSVRVAESAHVAAGDPVAVLESMKLETVLRAPADGVVREVWVRPNSQLAAGTPLLRIEPADGEPSAAPAVGVSFTALGEGCPAAVDEAEIATRRLQGFDCGPVRGGSGERAAQAELLRWFSRVCWLSAGRTYPGRVPGSAVNAREGLASFLRAPERSRDILPEELLADLGHTLAMFGAPELEPGTALHEAAYRLWRAVSAVPETAPVVRAVLCEWMGSTTLSTVERGIVEELGPAAADGRLGVGDLARAVVRRGLVPHHSGLAGGLPEWSGMHPATARRLELWRLRNFDVEHRLSHGDIHLLELTGKDNPDDHRLVVLAGIPELSPADEAAPAELTSTLLESFAMIRDYQAVMQAGERPLLNRVVLYVEPPWALQLDSLRSLARELAPAARDLGIAKVILRVRVPGPDGLRDRVIHLTAPTEAGMRLGETDPSPHPMRARSQRQQRLLRLHRRGLRDPYEIADLLTSRTASCSDFPPGRFREHDLDPHGKLVEVDRAPGGNSAGVVVGLIENITATYPEGMARVAILSDPGQGLGALAEPECRRIEAALDLADRLRVPVEWFSVSSGAKVAMDSGTENLDWVAGVLRRIVRFTQDGGEINMVVVGVNVGGQSYFNAEATMLMHTKGVLIMTPAGSMVLTGKDALDFAGSVSAEDNTGIGGFDRIMGPNGQAQFWAPDLESACQLLFDYYEHSYVSPGERFPRRRDTSDPVDRDVCATPHPPLPGCDFGTVGEIFSAEHNPGRKKPFDMRTLMRAVVDADREPLERWTAMAGAESAIVWETYLGGIPATMIGIESRSLPRSGILPADGPSSWSAATLFPRSAKKVARALNAASGRRPVVILANLAGFDGSPESMRTLQLEYGAEIGRALVNFTGPVLFCVVSRYHGGAFVVFSKQLNDELEVIAIEGAHASVIGGSAAAAVVFAREVERRMPASADPGTDREAVRGEVRAALAREFDAVHDIERACRVGSVDRVIPAAALRPEIIDFLAARTAGQQRKGRRDNDVAALSGGATAVQR